MCGKSISVPGTVTEWTLATWGGSEPPLKAVVGGELTCGHETCADAVGTDTSEAVAPSSGLVDSHLIEALKGVSVVSTLGGGEGAVILHADVEDVGGVAGDAAKNS